MNNSNVFNEGLLADKFSKLSNTQQCIETLSHLCIFHRDKAELVIATWDKQFHKADMIQKVSLLYLANDIMQNSKRKGDEFVTEFWKVLPAALKAVVEKGDDHGNKAVTRLVDIWEQRRIFGSRAKNLREIMLAEEGPPPLEISKKRSRSVRIMKRDSRSIKTNLSIGGAAEKIVSAFHLVLRENSSEDTEMKKCKAAVNRVRKMEEDVGVVCSNAKDPKRKILSKELEEEENNLKQCIEKLKTIEANRVALVSQLREALHEQESELETVRTQMQVAQARVEEASTMKKRLDDENYIAPPKSSSNSDVNSKSKKTSKKTAADIAAEVADKLAASSSSQYIMSSVLSTFAAEEAKKQQQTTSATPNSYTTMVVANPEHAMSTVSDLNNGFMQQQGVSVPPNNMYQGHYQIIQSPVSQQQYMQHSGMIMAAPYGYGPGPQPLPQGPPPPPHMVTYPQQQPPAPPSFRPLQPPGMVYYNQPQQ